MARHPQATWGGRAVQQARAIVATSMMPGVCAHCAKPVTTEDEWVVGHIKSRAAYPELTWEISNWRPEHRACSNRSGNDAIIEKARRSSGDLVFPSGRPPRKSRPVLSLPPDDQEEQNDWNISQNQPILNGLDLPQPKTASYDVLRNNLEWDPDYLRGFSWLEHLADVPEDASPPLYMSPVPDDAVGSYGLELVEWARTEHGIKLRWWQELALVRQYEYRADGTLCHWKIVETASRRSGKSTRMRISSLGRLRYGPGWFRETQLVMHTGSDIPICREIQRGAWRWATDQGWEVTRANGKEAIETLAGDRWLVRSQDGVYGYDVTLGLVDEGWNVKPDTVSEGIEPAILERSSPQVHLTSTAHRRATSLMKTAIKEALTIDDPTVLLLFWGAPPGSDPSDPAVWQAASPHWSEDRRKLIETKYQAALAGETDPQFDDPDPMAGFTAQYLNMWQLSIAKEEPGEPLTTPDLWDLLEADLERDAPIVGAAIESWFGKGVTLGLAHKTTTGLHLTAHDFPTLAQAVEALVTLDSRCKVKVGATLYDDPAVRVLGGRAEPAQGKAASVAHDLGRHILEGTFTHSGDPYLSEQILKLRTKPAPDGPRLVSKNRADAVKAVMWAFTIGHTRKERRKRMVLPT